MKPKEIFEELKGIGAWFDLEDIEEFAKLKLPKKPVILELGTGHGRSTRAMRMLWPDADITTCDPQVQCKHEDLPATFISLCGRELEWEKKLDLLFVDDDHVRDTVKEDIDNFKKLIKPDGYIIFHDYYGTGVKQAIDDMGLKVEVKITGDYSQAKWSPKWG